ncbi:MAG: SAM-dependent methyltransferase [Saprospiraceae bacterium]|nr:SAM-dependent methyltransferase [Saprospiraceae bacterium]
MIEAYLTIDFFIGHLFAVDKDVVVESSKKGKTRIQTQKPTLVTPITRQHDKPKQRFVQPERPYLHSLGITAENGTVTKQGQAKYKQIDKYIEILHHLMAEVELPSPLKIADMGSGKGYLTFALYDYLTNVQQRQVVLQGIELRPQLVELCNQIAQALSFDDLSFSAQDINDFSASNLDLLIALHACDTATDVAIAKGIHANAKIIVCAPCCHKQIRQQMKGSLNLQPILKHGILEERQAEILTDGIRALLLEAHGYATKVFEFISTEHTGKNLMIVGIQQHRPNPKALEQVNILKQQFGIEFHYLERLLEATV